MTRTSTRRIISSVMALALVCAMMLCGTTAFAAEVPETMETGIETAAARSTLVYSSSKWSFYQQKDTNYFSATGGSTVSFTMGSLSSTSGQGFKIKLCRVVNGVIQDAAGPISVVANRDYGSTITFNVESDGTYLVRCYRSNDEVYQYIYDIKVYVN